MAKTKTKTKTGEPQPAAPTASPHAAQAADGWLQAEKGYGLAIQSGKLVARNAKGQLLGSVPKEVKESELGEQLTALIDWLATHEREAVAWAELWMLRSLPIPTAVLAEVWVDDAYRGALENLVVFPLDKRGVLDGTRGGLLKGADPKRGVGVVDRDAETAWIATPTVAIPHPILIEGLDEWRALATELAATQSTQQLFREVFTPAQDVDPATRSIERFAGGTFKLLTHAIGTAKSLGFRVSGGSAATRVLERGKTVEARFWIGDEDPMSETETGSLFWVDEQQAEILVADVPAIAFSEGMRMASAIYAKRVLEETKEEA